METTLRSDEGPAIDDALEDALGRSITPQLQDMLPTEDIIATPALLGMGGIETSIDVPKAGDHDHHG